jgi:hypothetical protein
MPEPISATSLPHGVYVTPATAGGCHPSPPLISLLVAARSTYDWPSGTGPSVSQQTIINLEAATISRLITLNMMDAHQIVLDVSAWAGNNKLAHDRLRNASPTELNDIHRGISLLVSLNTDRLGVQTLCGVPGLSLVIASKIYRFCVPSVGAAVDRHSSYFTNSLPDDTGGLLTHFLREWSSSKRRTTRLATYNSRGLALNIDQYFQSYLPLLNALGACMNSVGTRYTCSATTLAKDWRPADVEMAAYYWWAQHGAR